MNLQTPERPVDRRRLLPSSLLVLALVTALASLGTPWFSSGTQAPGTTMDSSYTLWGLGTKLDTRTETGVSSVSTFTEWDRVSRAESARALFQTSLGLAVCGIALGSLFALSAKYLTSRGRRRLPLALGALACLLLFLAPVLFAALLPGALGADGTKPSGAQHSFWGSSSGGGERSSWGPGAGWVLALVAFLLLLSSFLSWTAHEAGWSFAAMRAALRTRAPAAHVSPPPSSAAPGPSPPPQAPGPTSAGAPQPPAPVLSREPETTAQPPQEGSGERAGEAAHPGQAPASAGIVAGPETGRGGA